MYFLSVSILVSGSANGPLEIEFYNKIQYFHEIETAKEIFMNQLDRPIENIYFHKHFSSPLSGLAVCY